MAKVQSVKPGRYKHYKGGLYDVLYNGTFEMDERPVVVYRSVADGKVWVRYTCYFAEDVKPGVKRFEYCPQSSQLHPLR